MACPYQLGACALTPQPPGDLPMQPLCHEARVEAFASIHLLSQDCLQKDRPPPRVQTFAPGCSDAILRKERLPVAPLASGANLSVTTARARSVFSRLISVTSSSVPKRVPFPPRRGAVPWRVDHGNEVAVGGSGRGCGGPGRGDGCRRGQAAQARRMPRSRTSSPR